MSRYKAALIHLAISALPSSIGCVLLSAAWYPPPYFQAAGGARLLLLFVCLNVALGPLLTVIVFKSNKPNLKFDLTIIALLQISALAYGLHIIIQSRPVFLVAVVDRYVLVAANELLPEHLEEAKQPQWRKLSWTGPALVATQLPADNNENSELMLSAMAGKDIEQYPRYYTPYEEAAPVLLQRAQPLARLQAMHPSGEVAINAWLRRNKRDAESVVWLPVVARMSDLTMLMDKTTGKPLGAIALDPWVGENGSQSDR